MLSASSNGIDGILQLFKSVFKIVLYILEAILESFRYQRVLLNGQTSKWPQIKAGVFKGSVLELLLFLVFINNLPEGLTSNGLTFC